MEWCTVPDVVSKAARCGHAVNASVFETLRCMGKEGTILVRDLVTAALATGLVKRVLLAAEAGCYLRVVGSRAATRSGRDTFLCFPSQPHTNVQLRWPLFLLIIL